MTDRLKRLLRLVRVTAWIGCALLIGALAIAMFRPQQPVGDTAPRQAASPPMTTPAFALTDQTGKRFTERDLAGRPYLLFFGFTYCPDVCPTTLSWITELLSQLGPEAEALRVILVSVDPERDTPEIMKDYIAAFDTRVIGLTGTVAEVKAMTERWGIYVRKVPTTGSDYTIDHTASVFTVGADGRFRGTLDIHDETPDVNLAKIRRLIGQRP